MNKSIRIAAIAVLCFNGVSAIFGGGSLVYDPSGEWLQMPLQFLEHSPFNDFLIPGMILLTVIGLFSIWTALLGIKKSPSFPLLTILCGILLTGWLTVQILMIQAFYAPAHVPYYISGIALIFLGGKLR